MSIGNISYYNIIAPYNGNDSNQSPETIGSGFIVSPNGVIVTNKHVVADKCYSNKCSCKSRQFREPLINDAGQVIGINTATDPTGQNISFALPISVVQSALTRYNLGL